MTFEKAERRFTMRIIIVLFFCFGAIAEWASESSPIIIAIFGVIGVTLSLVITIIEWKRN